jgi:hypothetical protein
MRVTSILVAAGFALFANAQTSTESTPASTSLDAAQASQSALQAEIFKCIDACNDGDVQCTSKCIAVPNPNESQVRSHSFYQLSRPHPRLTGPQLQVNATNTCVAACPQGNGTEADIANYSNCVSGCIAANYYTSSIGTPQPTGSAGNGNNGGSSGSGDSNGNGNGGSSGTNNQQASGSGTATGSAASSTSKGAAAAATAGVMGVGSGVVGVVGFVAAVMAL